MTGINNLIVNAKRLPATIKRLFRGTVYEVVGELLQNSQRAGASEIRFVIEPAEKKITIRDNGSGILPGGESWARILRMADSFYLNPKVENNQSPMGLGLLSLFALESAREIRLSSHGKTVRIDVRKLWESENYWASWTDLIEPASEYVKGFEIVISYDEPETWTKYQQLAHKLEYALRTAGDNGQKAAARGYQGYLKIFFNGREVDASIPREFVPAGENLIVDTRYEKNRLRIGQSLSGYADYGYIVWYGQLIKVESAIPFLLEICEGCPVTPLAPTRASLIADQKLDNLKRFVADAFFAALSGDEDLARRMKPQFIKNLYSRFPDRAKKELPVCVVEHWSVPARATINCYADFCDLGRDTVLSYREISERKIDVFQSSVGVLSDIDQRSFAQGESNQIVASAADSKLTRGDVSTEDDLQPQWAEIGQGLVSFASVLGGSVHQFIVGDTSRLPLKKIYWKPGAVIEKFFIEAGKFSVVPVDSDPLETDFRSVSQQVFVFEYTGNFDIEEIDGLCVGIPFERKNDFVEETIRWLGFYGKACYAPDDDYDYDRQEEDFDDSISRLVLELRRDAISSDWTFSELQSVIGRLVAERNNLESANCFARENVAPQISTISFPPFEREGERKLLIELTDKTQMILRIVSDF